MILVSDYDVYFTYDDFGQLISEKMGSSEIYNTYVEEYTYDEDGALSKEVVSKYSASSDAPYVITTNEYDIFGNLTNSFREYPLPSDSQKTPASYVPVFAEDGHLEKLTVTSYFSDYVRTYIVVYDIDGKEVSSTTREKDNNTGKVTESSSFSYYDEQNQLIKIEFLQDGKVYAIRDYFYKYDSHGNLLDETYEVTNVKTNTTKCSNTYTYDKDSNMLTHTYTVDGKVFSEEEYFYELYYFH
jgi:hypothetical protein